MKCPHCENETMIKVGTSDGVPFFACHTENCKSYAQAFVMTEDFGFVRYDKLIQKLVEVINNEDNPNTSQN